MTFNVNATTYFGENVYVIGSSDDLGAWDPENAIPLGAGGYTQERPLWSVSTYLVAGESVDWKFVRQEDCGQAWLYETANRTLVVPACGSAGIVEEDAWVGPVGVSGGC